MTTLKDFFQTIFGPNYSDKHIGVGSRPQDTASKSLSDIEEGEYAYYTLNALKPGSKRCDANVIEYLNFMLEFDEGTIQEQLDFIKGAGIPYTALVYSGKKSVHVIISLEEPVYTEKPLNSPGNIEVMPIETYKNIHRRMIRAFKADPANINPANFTRMPFTVRNGQLQSLLELKEPISQETFFNFINSLPEIDRPVTIKQDRELKEFERGALRLQTLDFLSKGDSSLSDKSKHYQLLDCVQDLYNQNYDEDEITHLLVKSAFTLRFPGRVGEVKRAIEYTTKQGFTEKCSETIIDDVSV